jgi:hypothetical protein
MTASGPANERAQGIVARFAPDVLKAAWPPASTRIGASGETRRA